MWESVFQDLTTCVFPIMRKRISYVLREFGTTRHENRCLIGNYIERAIVRFWSQSEHVKVTHIPAAARVDFSVIHRETGNQEFVSLKYSSAGNIKLHNSMQVNNDNTVHPTIVITPTFMCLLIPDMIPELSKYIGNKTSHLELKRSIFANLRKRGYPYIYDFPEKLHLIEKGSSKNRSMGDLLEEHVDLAFNDRKCARKGKKTF